MVVVYGLLVRTRAPRSCQQKVSAPGARDPVIVGTLPRMRLLPILWASLVVVSVAAPARADDKPRESAKKHVEFGIAVAQKGLWREAIYRWEQAAKIDPNYPAAYNDLAVAYEHEGQFDKARKAYEKALELEPENQLIRQNYELFKEINDRTNRRGSR